MTRQSASGAGKWKESPIRVMAACLQGEGTHKSNTSLHDLIRFHSRLKKQQKPASKNLNLLKKRNGDSLDNRIIL